VLENKEVNVDDLRPREDAVKVILEAIELYKTAVVRR
jgi:hypothetical protein